MKNNLKKFIFSAILFVGLIAATAALAQGIDKPYTAQTPLTAQQQQITITNSSIGDYIKNLYQYSVGIGSVLAVIVIMIGGIIWLTAGGSSERIGTARSYIGGALTGLILLLGSYLLLNTINSDLVKFKPLSINKVKEIGKCPAGATIWNSGNKSECETFCKANGGIDIWEEATGGERGLWCCGCKSGCSGSSFKVNNKDECTFESCKEKYPNLGTVFSATFSKDTKCCACSWASNSQPKPKKGCENCTEDRCKQFGSTDKWFCCLLKGKICSGAGADPSIEGDMACCSGNCEFSSIAPMVWKCGDPI